MTDRGGIRRILNNLIGNSIKFTQVDRKHRAIVSSFDDSYLLSQDGFIQIRLRELPLDSGSNKATIEIAVLDTGKV